ncbi:hypothetical protein QBZ16_000626 [Prototheca wickerhamii]|uniref:Rad51-like C-terminal domain-containing protein n=1 Tax=Prototheca wickerhamii TaxID=3111 RepID=A0AAD9IQ26_PROWI|nr:hypothetical protein QBZ16_000626 [Prototheca wickerhamii]
MSACAVMEPARYNMEKLIEIKGLSEAKVDKLVEAARGACPWFGIMSARDLEGQIGEGLVAYFDTEGTFRPERVRPIAERFNLDGDAVLSNILFARAYTFDQQFGGELAERQQKLGQLMNRLRKLADEFNIAVLITNQVVADPSGGTMFVVDPKKGKAEQRLMKVVDAPNLPEAEASYAISAQGIIDYKD